MLKGSRQSSLCLHDESFGNFRKSWNIYQCIKIIKATYNKPIANILLNEDKLRAFPLKSRMREGYPTSSLLFDIMLEVLPTAVREERDIRGITIGREEFNYFHHRWHDSSVK